MSSTREERAAWEQVRRGMMQTFAALQKVKPGETFSVEIRVLKHPESSTSET